MDLMHSYKGTTWKEHKYIKKDGSRYVYPKEYGSDLERLKASSKYAKQRWDPRPHGSIENKVGTRSRPSMTSWNPNDAVTNVRSGKHRAGAESVRRQKLDVAKLKIDEALKKVKNMKIGSGLKYN